MPTLAASRRRMRTQAEWKVMTHMARARGPTSAATRSRISAAALLVKVMARICPGWAPRSPSSHAMRWVSTRVLPEPAPATMSSGLPSWTTASRCCGLRPSRRRLSEGSGTGRVYERAPTAPNRRRGNGSGTGGAGRLGRPPRSPSGGTVLDDADIERILVVTAHPDDVDFGAGGTVAGWTQARIEVTYCLCTDGQAGGSDRELPRDEMARIRRVEQTEAARALGVTDLRFLGYMDGELYPTHDLRRDISRVIRQVRPQRVLTQSPERWWDRLGASHPDHRAAGDATVDSIYPDALPSRGPS